MTSTLFARSDLETAIETHTGKAQNFLKIYRHKSVLQPFCIALRAHDIRASSSIVVFLLVQHH
jgi:hypothetical protein